MKQLIKKLLGMKTTTIPVEQNTLIHLEVIGKDHINIEIHGNIERLTALMSTAIKSNTNLRDIIGGALLSSLIERVENEQLKRRAFRS